MCSHPCTFEKAMEGQHVSINHIQLTLQQLRGWGADPPCSKKPKHTLIVGPPYPGSTSQSQPTWLVQYCSTHLLEENKTKQIEVNLHRASWWLSGKESTCQCRRQGFKPWSRKAPHATGQLSPWATTTEPWCCNYWSPWNPSLRSREKPLQWEALVLQPENSPCLATARQSPHTATKTQHDQSR